MLTLLLLASLLAFGLLLHALFLWRGALWLGAGAGRPFVRAVVAVLLLAVVQILLLLGQGWLSGNFRSQGAGNWLEVGVAMGVGVVACWLVLRWVFWTSQWRAALLWLLGLVPTAMMLGLVYLVVRPYALDGYLVPTSSMAPTLVGWHRDGVCPRCGQTVFLPAESPDTPPHAAGGWQNTLGICSHCLKASEIERPGETVLGPDRFMVNKLLKPRRWDVITFRFPPDPKLKYAQRLVGLPGEEVYLRDGAVWVNGTRLTPPEPIAGVQYVTEVGGRPAEMGTPDKPWRLGDDEYCVLCDFSQRSSDSRVWGKVPGANVEGVAALRYWPPGRWVVWR